MKRTTIFLVFILSFSLVLPVLQIIATVERDASVIEPGDEKATLAATPGSDVHVIRVSDDTFTMDEEPSMTHDDFASFGGLVCGNDSASGGYLARIWMKFYLTHIPENTVFTRATLNLYMEEHFDPADEAFGVYISENDTWTESTITWDNEPDHNPVPLDVIDSPNSPNMFLNGNWYEWEITDEVFQAISEEGILTLVLRQVDESLSTPSMKGFTSRETSIAEGTNTVPNIALEYEIPSTGNLTVNGVSESPEIEYIADSTPEFAWAFNDADLSDQQKNYEVEVWNSTTFNETQLMDENHNSLTTLHNTFHSGGTQSDVFGSTFETRCQFLWPASLISQSGVVDKLYFEVDIASGSTSFDDLAIYLVSGGLNPLTSTCEDNFNGKTPIQVLNRTSYTASIENGYMIFDIENTFVLESSLNLIIEIRHKGASGSAQGYYSDVGGSTTIVQGPGAWAYHTCAVYTSRTQGVKLELASEEILDGGFLTNIIPFSVASGSAWRVQYKYNVSLFDTAGTIDRIRFPVDGFGDVVYENFSVYLLESPIEGELSHIDMDSNYGGKVPTLVLDLDQYTVRNTGKMLVLDINDIFTYTLSNDLLIEFRFDSLVSGGESAYWIDNGGAYRAYNEVQNDTNSPELLIDYVFDTESCIYSGAPLVNGTWYHWRVKTCDSMGIWSDWETGSFKYEILTSPPAWSNLIETSEPLEFGESMTISIDVTHTAGIKSVQIEYDGTNHSMISAGETYSHTWIPAATGSIPYEIFMESYSGTWGNVAGTAEVVDSTAPEWITAPSDTVLYYGEALSVQLSASDPSGIANWTIDDDANFDITNGLLTNKTMLAPGGYSLNVTVTDNEGNSLSKTFIVAVLHPTDTTTTTSTTTTGTTTTGTNTTGTTQPSEIDQTSLMIIIGLAITVVVLLMVIVIQNRRS